MEERKKNLSQKVMTRIDGVMLRELEEALETLLNS